MAMLSFWFSQKLNIENKSF